MGFPRRGCSTCKKRRIGCDSVRPVCGRCQKASRDCVWDPRDETGWRFENENAFAGGRLRRPRRQRSTNKSTALVAYSSHEIPHSLSIPITTQAVSFWLENFTFRLDDLPDIGHDFGAHVLTHLNASAPDSSLSLALSACSHAAFGRLRHATNAFKEGERYYAQSIMMTQEQIKAQLSQERLDQLLITIMLMANFENTMYGIKRQHIQEAPPSPANEVGTRIWKTICHVKGASGLMNLSQKLEHKPDMALHRAIRRQVVRTCTLRGRHVPPWIEDGAKYGETGSMLELDSLMVRVVALREASMPLFREKDPDVSAWIHLLKSFAAETQDLDIALAEWARSALNEWEFSTHPAPSTLKVNMDVGGITIPVHTYSTHAHATVWNHYRAIRLIVNSIRLRAFTLLLDCPTQCSALIGLHVLCQENIDALSRDLCGSVPFFFRAQGHVGHHREDRNLSMTEDIQPKMAELLAWPLTVAVSTESVPNSEKDWLRNILKICAAASGNAVLESVITQGEFRF